MWMCMYACRWDAHTHTNEIERERERVEANDMLRTAVALAVSLSLERLQPNYTRWENSKIPHSSTRLLKWHKLYTPFLRNFLSNEQTQPNIPHTHTHLHIVCIRINSICPSYFTLSFSIEWSCEKAKEQARTDSNCMHCRWWWCWFAYFSANEPNVINCSPYAMYLAQKRIIIFIDMLLFHLLAWFYFSSFSSIPHVHFLFHLCVLFLLPFLRCA